VAIIAPAALAEGIKSRISRALKGYRLDSCSGSDNFHVRY